MCAELSRVTEHLKVVFIDAGQQRARCLVKVVLRQGRAARGKRRVCVAHSIRERLGPARCALEPLHQELEVLCQALEAQHVVARPLDVQPLRQPVAICHRGALDARGCLLQAAHERELLLHTLDVLGRAAKHGVDAPIE